MNLEEKIIKVHQNKDLPNLHEIKSIPRGLNLKILFEGDIKMHRQKIGEKWQQLLPKFSVGIHTNGEEINIYKLITDKEIQDNQLFFEECAKEYGILGERLIKQFMKEFKVQKHNGFPLKTLNPYGKSNYEQIGEIGNWKYYFHGFHCAFTNRETNQHIEVPLTFGEEYGELDPYFFVDFIKTTPMFKPLPVDFFDDYLDGKRILEVMLKLGRIEKINSNLGGRTGLIVKNRQKKRVKTFNDGIEEVLRENDFSIK